MCYRGTDAAEIDAEDTEVITHDEPGRFGERSYHRQHQPSSDSRYTSADTTGIVDQIKALFRA